MEARCRRTGVRTWLAPILKLTRRAAVQSSDGCRAPRASPPGSRSRLCSGSRLPASPGHVVAYARGGGNRSRISGLRHGSSRTFPIRAFGDWPASSTFPTLCLGCRPWAPPAGISTRPTTVPAGGRRPPSAPSRLRNDSCSPLSAAGPLDCRAQAVALAKHDAFNHGLAGLSRRTAHRDRPKERHVCAVPPHGVLTLDPAVGVDLPIKDGPR